jgi:enoyl-CoA hydratase / 3-hydroxyacyl-CoA dehydrogenase
MSSLRIAVVGAGNMGAGIAQKFATEGAEVTMVDLSEEALERGLSGIRTLLEQGVERRVFRPEQAEQILSRLRTTTNYADLAGCDLVVEAVFENLAVKRDVFSKLDKVTGPETILATNTSSFRVTQLQDDLKHPERLVGLHYFFHPAKNRLVEVIPGDRTDDKSLQRAWALMNATGKTAIPSADGCGFIVNRFFVPWVNEGVRLLAEGYGTPGEIDRAARDAFRVGMGPFQLMNVTGVPISLHAATTLGQAFGSFYEPCERLREQVETGADWDVDMDAEPRNQEVIANRLRAAAWLSAGELVDEGIGSVTDTDIGARVGLRWPLGPFEMAHKVGLGAVREITSNLAQTWERKLPAVFSDHVKLATSTVSYAVNNGVATITLNRPDKLNALAPDLVADLEQAFENAQNDDDVRGIVLTGSGKAFGAGADLKFFVKAYDAGELAPVRAFTERGARLFGAIDNSKKRVVALVDGLSLGGGTELLLCADVIVATDRAAFGFPETGLGIYPGLGGTQRATRRVGRSLARWLIYTGKIIDGRKAVSIGFADLLVGRMEGPKVASALACADPSELPQANSPRDSTLGQMAERLFGDNVHHTWLSGSGPDVEDDALASSQKAISRKAPIALKVAGELIALGSYGEPNVKGLEAELARLEDVFATHDAEEGIRALVGRRRPTFQGS